MSVWHQHSECHRFRDNVKFRGSFLGGKVGIKLIHSVSDWAKSKGAEEIHIHTNSGIETMRTDKLLTRLGFKAIGANYVAEF